MTAHPLVALERCTVSFTRRTAGGTATSKAVDDLNWTLHAGEHWAIIGPNGAGKSTLLRLIRGEQRPDQQAGGSVTWFMDGNAETTPLAIRRRIAIVSSEMQEHYVRQQWQLSGEELLLTGWFDSPLLYEKPTDEQREEALQLACTLGVQHLLDMHLPAMSQGQLRKLLVARALVNGPCILVLDEVCEGLDTASRAEVLEIVDRAAGLGASVLFASHRLQELPACTTHAMLLRAGHIAAQGPVADVAATAGEVALFEDSVDTHARMPRIADRQYGTTPIFELDKATVFINRVPVLHDISWCVRPGENWAVCGSNGAGKSTLLRLLMGDERQAWGGTVRWFGESQPDMNIVRRRIGYVSDRFQATYGHDGYHGTLMDLSGEELVWSGFFASVGLWDWQTVTDEHRQTASDWMRYMGLAEYAGQRIRDMSYGRLRRFMLCRAMAPAPEILLLDEPCSGLDPASREHFLATLRTLAGNGVQMLYVTHYASELIPEITHVLSLENGHVSACGPREPASTRMAEHSGQETS
ncbi:ATP-binding cassette domain-containing protein [Desulfovibrio subterraneus]|uniref:ABC transporter ATP-binding protein n=1 Tax=Desulfovibrio subterraneus TaxID=2718620 RepID=UPI0022B871C5|nr:ATP-binding cassette domain-containing protein [Desulfovibrio subterraneus]WBF68411.1 ATP-binding cassette domain-containing protein [Desulfovibrio subterraneus]